MNANWSIHSPKNNFLLSFDIYLALSIGCFIITRIIAYHTGVRFDITPLETFWQFIDTKLLKTRLIESLIFLHIQPPLYNFFIGAVLKTFPNAYYSAFSMVYLFLGLMITIFLYNLITRMGISGLPAFIFTSFFTASPACILYENWLFYTYPLCALLLLLGILFHQTVYRPTFLSYSALSFCTAGIALTRSLFHLGWMVVILSMAYGLSIGARKRILLGAVVPLGFVITVYAKNAVFFSQFGVSSWFGMNISRITTFQLDSKAREKLIAAGVISELGRIDPFSSPSIYGSFLDKKEPTGVPVLDSLYKSSGETNFNYLGYINLYDQYGRDAIAVIKNYPGAWAKGALQSFCDYFYPASDYWLLSGNRNKIKRWDSIYSRVIYGQRFPVKDGQFFLFQGGHFISYPSGQKNNSFLTYFLTLSLHVIILYTLSYFACILFIWKSFTNKTADSAICLLILLVFTITWTTIMGNFFEVGENRRFRFMIDPYYVILIAYIVHRALSRSKNSLHAINHIKSLIFHGI